MPIRSIRYKIVDQDLLNTKKLNYCVTSFTLILGIGGNIANYIAYKNNQYSKNSFSAILIAASFTTAIGTMLAIINYIEYRKERNYSYQDI